ncbi:MAG TPA: hypothetical protein VIB39_16970 [Candidatus Angelobacter sp.]|jgi:hypothetical protein
MELLNRYLQAVRGYLLRGRRDDIVKELGDNILSQMEDKAAELGRPLNQAEQVAILKQHGHPLVAAARYRRLPLQQLVGPTLFPLYWYMLQAATVFVAAFHLMAALVIALSRGSVLQGIVTAWGSFWLSLLGVVGAVTIAFGLIEYFGGGKVPWTDTFDPLELPAIKATPPPSNSAVELAMGCFFLVGWPIFLHSSAPAFARSLPFRLAPVWWRFEIPMLLVVALGAAAAYLSLFRPQSPRLRTALRLASDVAGIVTGWLLLRTREFIVANPGSGVGLNNAVHFGEHAFTVGQIVNYGVALTLLITMIVFAVDIVVEATRLLRALRPPAIVTPSNGIL